MVIKINSNSQTPPRIMSRMLPTNHENIYNIIKKEDAKPPPKKSAKSPFVAKFVEAEMKGNKHCHKTFGFAKVPLKKPSEFLRKNSRILPPCPKIEEPRCLLSHRLPKIPPCIQSAKKQKHDKHTEDQVVEEEKEVKAKQDKGKRKNGHNYCYQNIEEAKKLVPRQPKRKYVDTRKGDAHDLQCSGLEPQYVLKKNFGRVPSYLRHRQLQAEALKKEMEAELNQFKLEGRYITESERTALLQGLKQKWEELHAAYQKLPLVINTISKKNYKIKLEEEMEQLENDIRTLECHQHIYVKDADCSEFS